MTEKQKYALDTIVNKLPSDCQAIYREIAEYAMSLGYNPKLNPGKTYADFVKSKHRKTIMKIDTVGEPRLAVRFDALPVCSGIFQKAVEKRREPCISKKYNHCARKVHCGGNKFTLPNGEEYVICSTVIDIPSFGVKNISEIKEALKVQDNYLMSLIAT